MYTEKTRQDMVKFLNQHIDTQLKCMVISQEVNAAGFPGYGWMFQVQSSDEFAHQRRIINYLQNTPGWDNYQIEAPKVVSYGIKTPVDAVSTYIKVRTEMIDNAEKFRDNAKVEHDNITEKFYDWFIQDGWEEVQEYSDLRDRLNAKNCDWGRFDLDADATEEIDLDDVINPMKAFIPEGNH